MGLEYLSAESIPAITIGAGQPWDIFFFVSEISAGASKRHFNSAYGSMLYAYRKIGLACAKAIFAQSLGLPRTNGAARFIVVRVSGQASGAALLRQDTDADGAEVLLIEFLAVTPAARRHGIGRILVEYAQRQAPVGGVECFCAQESEGCSAYLSAWALHAFIDQKSLWRRSRRSHCPLAGSGRASDKKSEASTKPLPKAAFLSNHQ